MHVKMSLFRRFFYRRPPDGLLEISYRVYVFDSCFSTDVFEDETYRVYMRQIATQLHEQFAESSFLVFNFREGERKSYLTDILSQYGMVVMDYPRQYEGCPLLPMEMIHHFLRSSDSWLSLEGHQNIVLMHCERGGWPLLAFMISSFLIYRKLHTGEQKILDMLHREAPKGLLQLLSPLNPIPSQVRYLQYVARRKNSSEWPPSDRVLTLDCLMLRAVPSFDSAGGCRPFVRIYGRDAHSKAARTAQMLFMMGRKKSARYFRQVDCDVVKIDVQCPVQGDVVLECTHLETGSDREVMMFRAMFNTAFIRSNMLILYLDDIDIFWNAKERFTKDFRAEVLFGEPDTCPPPVVPVMALGGEEKGGLPVEAFPRAQELFSKGNWDERQEDAAIRYLQRKFAVLFQDNVEALPLGDMESFPQLSSRSAVNSVDNSSSLSYSEAENFGSAPVPRAYHLGLNAPAASHGPDDSASIEESSDLMLRLGLGYSSATLPPLSPSQVSGKGPSRVPQSWPSSASAGRISSPPPPSLIQLEPLETSLVPIPSGIAQPPPSSVRSGFSAHSPGPVRQLPRAPPPPPPPLPVARSRGALPLQPRESLSSGGIGSHLLGPLSPSSLGSEPNQPQTPPTEGKTVISVAGGRLPLPPPPPPFPARKVSAVPFPQGGRVPGPPPPPPYPGGGAAFVLSAAGRNPPSPPLNAPGGGKFPLHSLTRSPPQPSASGGRSPHPPSVGEKGLAETVPLSRPSAARGRIKCVPAAPFTDSSVVLKAAGSKVPDANLPFKKAALKPLHWVKVTRAVQGSLWAENQKQEEDIKGPEIDMNELESLFSNAVLPSATAGCKIGRRPSTAPKQDKIRLVDLRRANNCEIMLTKIKMPMQDMLNGVLNLDRSVLDMDQVENLIKFCPSSEEMDLLKGFVGDKETLGKAEQFFLALMRVPRMEAKLRVFSFKISFATQISELRLSLVIVNEASREVRESIKLRRIMQTILSLGNALNQGTARGSAIGFKLDSLLKLTDTRARNNTMTLMHYLCKVVGEKLPDLLDFHKDLTHLEEASKIQLKTMAEEMQAISKGLEKIEQELTASENDGPVSNSFREVLKEFLNNAEAEVRSLAALYSEVGRNADSLAQYFGEDPARCAFEQVTSILLNFVLAFKRALEDNKKQAELEKKKSEKTAEKERMKSSPSKAEAEDPLP